MTAKDSKSTPKKAEDQPRHPLALLARKWEHAANFEAINIEEVCAFRRCTRELRDLMTQMESQESALRAQAEAEARLQAENAALRRKIRRIESVKRFMAEQIARRTPASFYEAVAELDRALAEPLYDPQTGALAQAGGESL
ncbi:hypothetical protein [Deinococcus kurensis]|uniref:hypothetical protein n=1 Tax=Deinococcus kurensis TaxID=2662757 RepID=UPI0012D334F9|nr:hypothetical protein [Deinococcus kurensis]